MNTQETFTSEEIMNLFKELDVDVIFEAKTENEVGVATIYCELGPLQFTCALFLNEPFFEHLGLLAWRYNRDDCIVFANNFNRSNRISHVVVDLDKNGQLLQDEDGDTCLHARFNLSFAGGVTQSHIKYLLELWIEELIDFYEIELEDEDASHEENNVDVPQSPEFLEMPLVERVTAFLKLNSNKSAKDMSKSLGFDRNEINQVLYRHRDRFVKNKSQPPQWCLKEND